MMRKGESSPGMGSTSFSPPFLETKAWKTWMQPVAPLVLLAELIPAD